MVKLGTVGKKEESYTRWNPNCKRPKSRDEDKVDEIERDITDALSQASGSHSG
jgi:hypothetical protein